MEGAKISDTMGLHINCTSYPLLVSEREINFYFVSVQLLGRVQLFVTPWTAACQASLSITNFQSLLKLMSIEPVMPPNHLILCYPLLLLFSILPSIRVISSESVLCTRWPKYWSFSFSITLSYMGHSLACVTLDKFTSKVIQVRYRKL